MSGRYEVRVFDVQGNLQAVFDNFMYLEIEHTINAPSTHRVDIKGSDERKAYFVTDAIVQVWRRDVRKGVPWYAEYSGFHRTHNKQFTTEQKRIFTTYGKGFLDLIARRFILYYSGVGKAGPGDSVIVEYVNQNAGPDATAPPRLYPGIIPGLSVTPAEGNAEDWDADRAWVGLLETIQEIGTATKVDFDVVWNGGQSFTFNTYHPRKGTDRTAGTDNPAVFSTDFGNMIGPSYTYSRTEEANVVIVLGPGQEEDRETLLVSDQRQYDSPWNRIEVTHDARNDEVSLLSDGKEHLSTVSAKETFTFDVLQTESLVYGRDYFVGDLVTARFEDIERDIKITGARIVVSEGKETISITFELQNQLDNVTIDEAAV